MNNNILLDRGIILSSGEISKDKINLVAGAITQPFAEMVWVRRYLGGIAVFLFLRHKSTYFNLSKKALAPQGNIPATVLCSQYS